MKDGGARDLPLAESGSGHAAWIEGALLAGAVLLLLAFGGDTVRASYHGFLHITVGRAILAGGLLPENPYHAGVPLHYYTLYPALGVLIGKLGCGPFWGFASLDVLAALLFAPALDALGRGFALSWRGRRAAFLAAVLGFNALGWIGFLLPHPSSPPGTAPVFLLGPSTFQGYAIHWDRRLQSFLPKFLNVSSFALAVPFALWALAGAAHAWRSSRASFRVPGRVALAAGLALALNPLVGGYCGLLLLLWLFPGMLRHHDREAGFWLLGGLGALLFALPFLLPALRPAPHGGPEIQVQLGSQPLFDLLGPLFLLLAPALFGLRRFEVSRRWRWAAGAVLAALLLVGARLPWGNQYKMARLGALLWALPTGAWLAERVHRPRLIVLLVILALPTTLAVPWAYLSWARDTPPLPLVWEDGALRPRSLPGRPTLPVSILEVEAAADPAAVLLADPYGLAGQLGGGRVQGQPLAPLFHHPLVVDALQVHNEGQPDLARRLACANALWNPDPMRIPFSATSGLARLRALLPERPFLILARREDHRLLEALSRAGATVLRDEQGFSLWRLPPLRPGGGS